MSSAMKTYSLNWSYFSFFPFSILYSCLKRKEIKQLEIARQLHLTMFVNPWKKTLVGGLLSRFNFYLVIGKDKNIGFYEYIGT